MYNIHVYIYIYICIYIHMYIYICTSSRYLLVISNQYTLSRSTDLRGDVYDSFYQNCYTPEIHQIQKLRFLGILRYKIKVRFWFNLNLYQKKVSGFGGFRGCSIFSGNCRIWCTGFWVMHICIRFRPYVYENMHMYMSTQILSTRKKWRVGV